MPRIKARVLVSPIETFQSPLVAGLTYKSLTGPLTIAYRSDGDGEINYEIIFDRVRGFKLLDEGDMINYWEEEFMRANWLFEIESGGWLDIEDNAGGFTSKMQGFREFLITGIDDCVSVISNKEPTIVKLLATEK